MNITIVCKNYRELVDWACELHSQCIFAQKLYGLTHHDISVKIFPKSMKVQITFNESTTKIFLSIKDNIKVISIIPLGKHPRDGFD